MRTTTQTDDEGRPMIDLLREAVARHAVPRADPISPRHEASTWEGVVDLARSSPAPGGARIVWVRMNRLSEAGRARLGIVDDAREPFLLLASTPERLEVERVKTREIRALRRGAWIRLLLALPISAEALVLALWTPEDPIHFDSD